MKGRGLKLGENELTQRIQWRHANLDELYTLTVQWLREEISVYPAYPHQSKPNPETIEIAADLAALNQARLILTTRSQPATSANTRGFITGFAPHDNIQRMAEVMEEAHSTRLITQTAPRRWWQACKPQVTIPVTRDANNQIQRSITNPPYFRGHINATFGDILDSKTISKLTDMVHVTLVDLHWGDDSDMWRRLLSLLPNIDIHQADEVTQ